MSMLKMGIAAFIGVAMLLVAVSNLAPYVAVQASKDGNINSTGVLATASRSLGEFVMLNDAENPTHESLQLPGFGEDQEEIGSDGRRLTMTMTGLPFDRNKKDPSMH